MHEREIQGTQSSRTLCIHHYLLLPSFRLSVGKDWLCRFLNKKNLMPTFNSERNIILVLFFLILQGRNQNNTCF